MDAVYPWNLESFARCFAAVFSTHDNGDQPKPTVPEMITMTVSDFLASGLEPPTGEDILRAVGKRWNQNDPNIVRPSLWRMVKANRLIQNGKRYSLPVANQAKEVEPPGEYSLAAP